MIGCGCRLPAPATFLPGAPVDTTSPERSRSVVQSIPSCPTQPSWNGPVLLPPPPSAFRPPSFVFRLPSPFPLAPTPDTRPLPPFPPPIPKSRQNPSTPEAFEKILPGEDFDLPRDTARLLFHRNKDRSFDGAVFKESVQTPEIPFMDLA